MGWAAAGRACAGADAAREVAAGKTEDSELLALLIAHDRMKDSLEAIRGQAVGSHNWFWREAERGLTGCCHLPGSASGNRSGVMAI